MKTGDILGWMHVLSRQKIKTCCEWFSLQRKKKKKDAKTKQENVWEKICFCYCTNWTKLDTRQSFNTQLDKNQK